MENKTRRWGNKIFVVLGLIVVGLALIIMITFFSVVVMKFFSTKEEIIQERTTTQYNILQVNQRHESYVGKVSIYEEIGPEEFKYYVDGKSNHVLISPFGLSQYQCTGHCFCDDQRSSLNLAVTGSRALFYLTAAVSTGIAFSHARKYFQDECLSSELSESCQHAVKAEVEECKEPEVVEAEIVDADNTDDQELEKHTYWCVGHCMTRKTPHMTDTQYNQFVAAFNCDVVEGSQEVVIMGIKDHQNTKEQIKLAQLEFQNKYLLKLCFDAGEQIALKKLKEESNDPKINKKQNEAALENVRNNPVEEWGPCVSYQIGKDNPTIQCRPS